MKATPKIRGFLAARKNKGLFLYRRSNMKTYLISFSYERKIDKFTLGSGFYGRIYPNRCDISPDGNDFIYFAMGASLRKYGAKFSAWTAICKPPEIRAHLFIGQNHTWGGGGLFLNEREIFLNADVSASGVPNDKYYNYKIVYDVKNFDYSMYFGRGWQALEKNKYGQGKLWQKECGGVTIERNARDYNVKDFSRRGEYSMFTYIVKDKEGNVIDGFEKVNWCDFDNLGRLITAEGSLINIYEDAKSVVNLKAKVFDLEELVIKGKS